MLCADPALALTWLLCSSRAQCSLLCSAAPNQTYNLSAISSDKLVAELFPKRRSFLAKLVQRQGPMLGLLLTSTGMALFSQLVADQVSSSGLNRTDAGRPSGDLQPWRQPVYPSVWSLRSTAASCQCCQRPLAVPHPSYQPADRRAGGHC